MESRFRGKKFILLGIMLLGLSITAWAQKVSLNCNNVELQEVLLSLKQQTGYDLIFSDQIVNVHQKVSIQETDKELKEVLNILFKNGNITFEISNKRIYLVEKKQSGNTAKRRNITGTVKDVNGYPIIGASIRDKNDATVGTITDINGAFLLENVSGSVLLISYIGYQPLEVTLKDKTNLNITLKEDTELLEEVVVVGFGTQKKVNLSGAVSAVSGDDIAKRPVANTAVLLQGQVPGLWVNQGTGAPGDENVRLRIRGQGTFSSAGSDPLVLINGVAGDMTNIDPSSVESISVLKDASSAAIYGARAANGVILITTKSGNFNEKGRVRYHGNIGFHSATNYPDLVTNSVEYMNLFNMAAENSGRNERYPQEVIDLYRNNSGSVQYPNFNWLDYMFRTVMVQNHNVTVSGGGEKASYNIALNYVDQPGTLRGFSSKKYNVTIDLTAKINDRIKVGSYTSLMHRTVEQPRQGQEETMLATMSQTPLYMPWLPDDGSGVVKYTDKAYSWELNNKNMLAIIAEDAMKDMSYYDVNSQLWFEANLFKGLTWYGKAAARLNTGHTENWGGSPSPVYNYHTGEKSRDLDRGNLGLQVDDSRHFYTNLYTYLKYETTIKDAHSLNIMAGYSQEYDLSETLNAYRKYYSFDLHTIGAGTNAEWTNGGGKNEWAIQSLFGRLNYDFMDRYLLEMNVRYDGTSRLASENRWGVFPSFSAAWRVTEEPFIKKLNIGWLNNLKIRGSWGMLGNQNIGNYPYQAMIASVSNYPFAKDDASTIAGYQQTAYANRDIKWETTTITDIGFDLQVLRGLSVTFDWYNKRTEDILRSSQVSALLGLSAPTVNQGTVQNRGIELSVNYSGLVNSGWANGLRYNVGVYMDRSRNELVKFGAEQISGNKIRREGLPYDTYYMLECIGVFATQEEVDNSPKQFNDKTQPGDLKFRDVDGDGDVDNDDRRTFDGNFPGLEYGLNMSASWKGFDFSLLGQGILNKKYYSSEWFARPFRQGTAPSKEYVAGMWTEENPYGATHPKLYIENLGGSKNNRYNSYMLKDVSFFRIKNITLGYTLPANWTQKVSLSKVRVYFSGDNLFTFTPYTGLDPERGSDGYGPQYPQNKICSFGINVEF